MNVVYRNTWTTLAPWGPFVLRVIVGLGLFAHGYQKMFELTGEGVPRMVGFTQMVGGFGFPGPPEFWAWAAALTELVGGALLVVGLLTRVVAVLAIILLLVATIQVKWPQGWIGGYELDLLYIGALVSLFLTGPGALSMDEAIRQRRGGRWI
ncbi:DoxX family protein [soil metagenome]|nr:DoxX family protein [Gemmatimonadota bacterium]